MTIKIGSIDRLKIVSEAIESVRHEARKALDDGQYGTYSNLMFDLGALELVLANETKYYLDHIKVA